MKSKTSSYKRTLLRKDIFRFAPLWVGFSVLVFACLQYVLRDWYDGGSRTMILLGSLGNTGTANMIYAGLVAMFLFGDLFSEKRCQALHAMPVRRERWFFSHVLHGVLYGILPNLLVAACVASMLGSYWYLSFVWVLGMLLQYLFFFGLAVLCVFLSGNWIGMVLFYGFLNYACHMFLWILRIVYLPFLYGVSVDLPSPYPYEYDPIYNFCPVKQFRLIGRIFAIKGTWILQKAPEGLYINFKPLLIERTGFTEALGQYLLFAGAGVVLMALALLLYRKRKLECAGDLTAFRFLPGVISAVCPFLMGYAVVGLVEKARNYRVRALLTGVKRIPAFFVVTILSWFAVEMFRKRTVKIFSKKMFLRFGIFVGSIGLLLSLSVLDPFGVVYSIPETQQIQEAVFADRADTKIANTIISGTDVQTIEAVRGLHAEILKHPTRFVDSGESWTFTVRYTLKDGKQIQKTYPVRRESPAWNVLQKTFCTAESMLGYDGQDTWKDSIQQIRWNNKDWKAAGDWVIYQKYGVSTGQIQEELIQAILDDCKAGSIVPIRFAEESKGETNIAVQIVFYDGGMSDYIYITKDAKSCLAWQEKYADLLK